MIERGRQYGPPQENLACADALIQTYRRYSRRSVPSTHDHAVSMALMKIARIATGRFDNDHYIDAKGYLELARMFAEDEDQEVRGRPRQAADH